MKGSHHSTARAPRLDPGTPDPAALLLAPGNAPRPADAVAALLVLADGRYVMQLRDAVPSIFYPDHWGCFGGAVERGEDLVAALRRELYEELEFEMPGAERFSQFDFDFTALGHPKVYRVYFEVLVPDAAFARFVLHEGAEVRAFSGPELLTKHRVTPYDAFAVWMHLNRPHYRTAG